MAKRWINVDVTLAMTEQSKPYDCYMCLVAIALREATGFIWHVTASHARIEVYCGPPPRRTWKLPPQVRYIMSAFDTGNFVKPTTFRLPARFADKKFLAYGAGIDSHST